MRQRARRKCGRPGELVLVHAPLADGPMRLSALKSRKEMGCPEVVVGGGGRQHHQRDVRLKGRKIFSVLHDLDSSE